MTFVDSLTVIRAICRHRRNVSVDLIKQVRNFGDIADIIRRQFHRNTGNGRSKRNHCNAARQTSRDDCEAWTHKLAAQLRL
jgi:hypothetical protein